jgi:hypothetical protein
MKSRVSVRTDWRVPLPSVGREQRLCVRWAG